MQDGTVQNIPKWYDKIPAKNKKVDNVPDWYNSIPAKNIKSVTTKEQTNIPPVETDSAKFVNRLADIEKEQGYEMNADSALARERRGVPAESTGVNLSDIVLPTEQPKAGISSTARQEMNVPDKTTLVGDFLKPDVLNEMNKIAKNLTAIEVKNRPTNLTEKMDENLIPARKEIFGVNLDSPLGRIAGSGLQGLSGVAEGVTSALDWAGVPGMKESSDALNKFTMQVAPNDPNYAEKLASGAASMAAFMIPGLGVAKGAQAILNWSPKIAKALMLGVPTVLEAVTEAGNTRSQMIRDGKDESTANKAAGLSTLANLVAIGITNKLGILGDKGNSLRQIITSAIMEGSQEGIQNIIDKVAQGKEIDPKEVFDDFAIGGIIGGGIKTAFPEITNITKQQTIPSEETQLKDIQGETIPITEKPPESVSKDVLPETAIIPKTEVKAPEIESVKPEEIKTSDVVEPEAIQNIKETAVKEKVVTPVTNEVAKEPWEMTKKDFESSIKEQRYSEQIPKSERPILAVKANGKVYTDKNAKLHADILDKIPDDVELTGLETGWIIDDKFEYQVPRVHEQLVQQAIKEGKPVPEEVLKDYPDLTKNVKTEDVKIDTRKETEKNLGLVGIKDLPDGVVNALNKNKKILDTILDQRADRRRGELSPNEKRYVIGEIRKGVSKLRAQGIDAKYDNDNLYIDGKKIYPANRAVLEKIEDVEITNEKAKTPFKKLSNEESDRQTFMAGMFSEKKYLPSYLKNLLPKGFGQQKIDKGVSDIKEDAGKEQSEEAQIVRDFVKELDQEFEETGYIKLTDGSEINRENLEIMVDEYIGQKSKETQTGDTSFEFGGNVKEPEVRSQKSEAKPQIEKTKAGDQYTLGSEMKPSFPTKAKFEGKADLSEETPLFQQEKVDKGQIEAFETPKSLAKEEPKNVKNEIKLPKGSNAVIVDFADGKQSKLPISDIDAVGTDFGKIKNISFGKVETNKTGGLKWETFREEKSGKPEDFAKEVKQKNFSDIVDEKSNEILESEKVRMQKESLGSGELKSTFTPFSSLIDKITSKNEPIKSKEVASSGNEKIDSRFITNTPTWREKRLENTRHIAGLIKEKLQFLHDIKSDQILRKMKVKDNEGKESSAIDYLSTEVDILKQKLTAGVKDTTRKTLYSIFGDMNKDNLEKGIYNVGKYAGVKRLKAIMEDANLDNGAREKILKEYSKEEIDQALTELEKNLSPEEKRSYERMNELLSAYGEELVSEGLIEKTTTDYFPFRVIDFIDKIGTMNAKKGMFRKETPQSSLKFTGGSVKHAVNIDVMQVLSDYFRQNERAKAINEFEKTVLKKFNDPDMKGKDGWTEYEFNPKRGYIKLYSTIEKVMKDAAVDLPKDVREQLGKIFFGGGKNYTVPEGLSKQLSNLYAGLLPSQVPIIGGITRQFKKQMVSRIGLFNVLFQARNMRTDMKKEINNNPAAFSSLPQTEKFLFNKMNIPQKGYLHFIDLASFNKIVKQAGRVDKAIRGIDIKPEQMESAYKEFEEGGLGGRLTTEAYEITDKDFNRKFLMQGLKQNLSEFSEGRGLSGFLEGFDKTMQMRETILRFNQYVYDRHVRGLSKAEAHENVARTFINYNHFTEFENKWLRNLFIPFYSWAKGNPEMTYESFVKGNGNTRARIMAGLLLPAVAGVVWNRMIAPEDEEKLNNDPNKRYIAENFHFATNWFDKNGNRIYIFDQSWEDDITNYVNLTGAVDQGAKLAQGTTNIGDATASYLWDTFHGNMKTGLNYVNPIVKAPFEIVSNKNIYSGYPIWKENDPAYNKMIKLAMYEGFSFDRNASTIRNLFVGKQDWTMKGMRLSGLPVTSVGLEKSPSNYELMNKEIFKERIKEITDFEKERDKLKEKALSDPTKENRYLYNEANEKLKKMRSESDAYQKHLDQLKNKREQENEKLGIERKSKYSRNRFRRIDR
jgi:hypothetical protein